MENKTPYVYFTSFTENKVTEWSPDTRKLQLITEIIGKKLIYHEKGRKSSGTDDHLMQ